MILGTYISTNAIKDEMIPIPEWINPIREMDEMTAILVMKIIAYAEQPSLNNQKYVVGRSQKASQQ